ncbi:MAG: DUF1552 domain-containing protein [Polyangiaceae bacterium]|nr:DUF1552 domain-containing protein [Polyangiaceae bacterium]
MKPSFPPTSRTSSHISRRSLVANTALSALLAPVLRQRDAWGSELSPRRVIFIFSPNGPMMASGPVSGTEHKFKFHEWWGPLARHRAEGIFFSHMAATGQGVVKGNGHGLGGQVFSGYGAGFGGNQYANMGETVDQVIGRRLEAENRAGLVRSLVWGLAGTSQAGGTGEGFCAAPGRNISPEANPKRAFAQIFGRFMDPSGKVSLSAAEASITRDRSVLDFLARDCAKVQSELGTEASHLLDDHCTTLRSMERNLVSGFLDNPALNACQKPRQPAERDWGKPEHIEPQMAAFNELISTVLACELSHVIAFQFAGQAARNRLPEHYKVPSSAKVDSGDSGPAHHPWTHNDPSAERTVALRIFTRFYATQVASLLDKLKATRDAHGKPLLDSTLVVWASELGGNENTRDPHETGSLPVMLFGSGQGTFKTGRYLQGKSVDTRPAGLRAAGEDMARLLVSAVQYMGLPDVKTVGATMVDGPLSELYT